MPTWYHFAGSGQFFKTCKFHRFSDCQILKRGRKIWCGPVQKWQTTTEQTSVDRPESKMSSSSVCRYCEKRHSRSKKREAPACWKSSTRKKYLDDLKLKFEILQKSSKEQEKLLEFYREFVGKMTSTSDKNVAWKTTKEFSSDIMWQTIGNDLKTRYERHSFLFG